ncbi:cupin domain-containing protein [Starkeya koreensis]|uniref:Cupin domain-containing protein n=1 Tax=Ancylobacter koreensis TaxID=266121 RepID=A0ABT0DPQ8_9HYPH|nr:cupin domain-containing protein [Ancylobacter koreensis]MCK0209253.1 cupin domain-containing protein [Ancylobacter koreensis]
MPEPQTRLFPPSHGVPNNPSLPVLIYKGALPADAGAMEAHIGANGWDCRWRDGIFDFHHFHSTAHEALAIARGHARVRLGGEDGAEVALHAGDVLVLPAGTGHMCLEASDDFLVVGAYPPGQDYEIEKPDEALTDRRLATIARVPLPSADPVGGRSGALVRLWKA